MRKAGPTPESRVAGEPRGTRSRPWRLAALLVAVMMVIAACGDAEEPTETSAAGDDAPATTATTTGGGDTTTTAGTDDTSSPDAEGPSGTLTIAVPWDPQTLDPQMHRNRFTQVIARQMHEHLTMFDFETTSYYPVLAESWTKLDDVTWEFKLREGVTFHNGEPFTAEAVKATFDRMLDPATESPRASMNFQTDITEIEVVDDYTVRFHTAYDFGPEDDPSWLGTFSQEILEPTRIATLSKEEFAEHPIGTGPFKFVEWVPNQRLVVEANLDYRLGPPRVEQVIWRPIPEASTRVAEFLAGSVDIIFPVDADTAAQLEGRAQLLSSPGTQHYHLAINTTEGPFTSQEARIALNQAIDKQAIVDNLMGGLATVSNQIAFSGQRGYDPSYEGYPYDPEAAQAVLGGITDPIEMVTESANATLAEAVAEQLRQVGLDVTVVPLEGAAYSEVNEGGDYTLAFGSFASGTLQFAGPYYNAQFHCDSRANGIIYSGFCDPEIDELIAQAEQESDLDARNEIEQEANRRIMENPPWVPLWVPNETWAVSERVSGFKANPASQFELHGVSVSD